MALVPHTPDPAQGAIINAFDGGLGRIIVPDDNELVNGNIGRAPAEQLADWVAFLVKGPANDIDYKITGNGTPPSAGYTPTTRPIEIKGTQGMRVSVDVAPSVDPGANRLAGPSLIKAWAYVATDGSGGVDFAENYGITSVSLTSTHFVVTFSHAFASTKYSITATAQSDIPIARVYVCGAGTVTASVANIYVWNAISSTLLDPTVSAFELAITACGRQV